MPTKIVGDFNCGSNQLTSLFGCPRRVVGYFSCVDNKLTSLEHCPKEIVGDFYCNHNQITSLEHCPQHVDGAFNCYNNPVDLIVSSFTGSRKMNEFIELFNYTDIVQGNKVIYDRLVWFYEEIGIQLPDMSEIAKHYKIIR